MVRDEGRDAIAIAGDASQRAFAEEAVDITLREFGKLDVLVNHVGIQTVRESFSDITPKQLHETYQTNVFSMFYFTQAALPRMEHNGSIINSAHFWPRHRVTALILLLAATSVTAYKGNPSLIDYSSSKGAQVSFTYSLAQSPEVLSKGIRVNAVAPGPIWTPLIPATFPKDKVGAFGAETPECCCLCFCHAAYLKFHAHL
jgi:NAD(P)-dependent dehydrogenase (short-subunit alcohol dehydrogenase family)